jgi:hypothetical protein
MGVTAELEREGQAMNEGTDKLVPPAVKKSQGVAKQQQIVSSSIEKQSRGRAVTTAEAITL